MVYKTRSFSGRWIDYAYHSQTRIIVSRMLMVSLIAVFILLPILTVPRLVSAQEENYPVPIAPENGKTDVPVTNIIFSWKRFYVGTMEYTFQLSKDTAMPQDDLVIEAKTQNGSTTYQYRDTLEYDTTYFWWVSATDPIGGVWSPVFNFTTVNAPDESEPESEDTEESSFIDFFKDLDWLLVGLIAAAVIVVILAVFYLMKPKQNTPRPDQWQTGRQQIWGNQQQSLVCQSCGTQNPLGRKFCNNCGGPLMTAGPQQQWGPQQTMKCPSCGMLNDISRKFCSNCGATLKPEIKQPEQLAPQMITCPTCGASNSPGGKFCNNCGGNLMGGAQPQQQPASQALVCPACGTTNPPGGKFCNNCGGNLFPRPPQQETTVQSFACPVCGAILAPNTNPCTSCGTWLDWRS
jgi:DNA-directed RNA polymerase subunit M/transcription elongation factor TFIIS